MFLLIPTHLNSSVYILFIVLAKLTLCIKLSNYFTIMKQSIQYQVLNKRMEILTDFLFNMLWLKSSIELIDCVRKFWDDVRCSDRSATLTLHRCQGYCSGVYFWSSTYLGFVLYGFTDHVAPTPHSHWPLPDNTREIWSFPVFSLKEVILWYYHP